MTRFMGRVPVGFIADPFRPLPAVRDRPLGHQNVGSPISCMYDSRMLIWSAMNLYTRGSARRSLVDTVAFRAVSQVSTFLGYVILVRGMSEESFGVYSLLFAFIPVVSTIASLGLEQVLRRYQPEYLRSGNKLAAAWLLRWVASARFIVNVIVLSVILLVWNYIAPVFNLGSHRLFFAAFCLIILLHFQLTILQMTLGSHMMHRYSVGSTAALSIIRLIAYSALFYLHQLSLEAAIAVDTVAYAVAWLSMRIAYNRKCLGPETQGSYVPTPEERKRLVRYGLFNNFNDASLLFMYSSVDSFFLAAFVSTTAVGVYSFYGRLKFMVIGALPVKLFDNVIQPMFFSVPTEEANRKIPQYFSFLINMNLLVQWPVVAFSFAYHAEIVQAIFGGKFIEYSWLMPMIMTFSAIVNSISDPATLVAQYEEKAGIILLSKLFALYNIAAMALLVPMIGVYGAAIAAGTAQIMKTAFIWWHVRRRAVWMNVGTALSSGLLLWGLGVGICLGIKLLITLPALVHLLIGGAVLGLIGLLHVRSGALSASDRYILTAVAPGKAAPILRRLGLLDRSAKPQST